MKAYIFLLICSQFVCLHSLKLRRIGHHETGLRRINRLDQRNLRVQMKNAPRTHFNSMSLCEMCLHFALYYGYSTNICSQYCPQPNIRKPTFSTVVSRGSTTWNIHYLMNESQNNVLILKVSTNVELIITYYVN